jgi:hypothetical protein
MAVYSSLDPVDIAIMVDGKAGDSFELDMSETLASQYLEPGEFYNESADGNLGLGDMEEIPDIDETSTDELDIAADDIIDGQYIDGDEDIIDIVAGLQ